MMKRLLFMCGIAFVVACAQEPQESDGGVVQQQGALVVGTENGAVPGTLAIRLSPAAANAVETAARTRSGIATRSGFDQMDFVFNQVGVEHFARIVPYDEKYEAGYRESGLSFWYSIMFDEKEELSAVVEQLRLCPEVVAVEYTQVPKTLDKRPVMPVAAAIGQSDPATRAMLPMNDPQLSRQWHYNNTGPVGQFTTRRAGADINLFSAWDICMGGEDIVVAVIDGPVQYSHPDLAANMWTNPNPTFEDVHGCNFLNRTAPNGGGNPTTLDWSGYVYHQNVNVYEYSDHGTHVAGTIAAVNNNGIGCCGIAGGKNGAGGVKIMSCQIMGNSTTNTDPNAPVKAFAYAANNGAVIAQCSWGYGATPEWIWDMQGGSLRSAIDYFINNAGSKNPDYPNSPLAGGLVIFAAGNDGHNVGDNKMWPSAYRPVISVAAIGWDFQPSYFTDYGTWVDITAPGGDYLPSTIGGTKYQDGGVYSTILQDPSMTFLDGRDNTGCGYMQGTSMACPHVSGVAALGLAYASKTGKKFTSSEFASLLLTSTHDLTPHLIGTKNYIKDDGKTPGVLNLVNYQRKMGRGYVDALSLLLNIQGTPAVYLQKGTPTTVDLSKYFGGSPATLTLIDATISPEGLQKLGLSAVPPFQNGAMIFNCKSVGTAVVEVRALSGDMQVTREFVIVSRDGLASNGGWL